MTIREAISAEIEPYSLSDESIEKGYIDSVAHFDATDSPSVTANYDGSMVQIVALASMYCLNRLRVLTSENIGGISQSYSVEQIERRIKGIAQQADLSPALVLGEGSDTTVTYQPVW